MTHSNNPFEALTAALSEDGRFAPADAAELARRPRLREALKRALQESGTPLTGGSSFCEIEPGFVMGNYEIDRVLGEGGMGKVHLGHHIAEGAPAAIKTVKSNDPELVNRFQRERKILARFHHERIARFLDSGTLPDGRPWLALEYIEGEPLTRWCDEQKLDLHQRLELFLEICEALSYAHQNFVLHRDLKPGNILVNNEGHPMLLDFGIAALLDPDSQVGTTELTRVANPVMTPEYASPEQIRCEPLTTSSDIYSLGIVLYELLTGKRPYHFPDTNLFNMTRAITEMRISKPSSIDSALGRRLRGDLDTIILKTLEREPNRRYTTVDALAEDLQRYLKGLPIKARPATTFYRLRKLAQRNPLSMGLLTLFMVSLMFFSQALYRQAEIARAARARAEQESKAATQVSEFLTSLFELVDPSQANSDETSVRDLVDYGRKKLDTEMKDQPLFRARTQATLGTIYARLGNFEDAEGLLNESLAWFRQDHARGVDFATLLLRHSEFAAQQHRFEDSRAFAKEALALTLTLDNNKLHADAMFMLGESSLGLFHHERAVEELNRAKPLIEAAYGPESASIATVYNDLGLAYNSVGDGDAAERMLNEAMRIRRKVLGDDHEYLGLLYSNLANLKTTRGELKEGLPLLDEAVRIYELHYEQHPVFAHVLTFRGNIRGRLGLLREGEADLRKALAMRLELLREDNQMVADSRIGLGVVLLHQNKPEGEALLREALQQLRGSLEDQVVTAHCLTQLGWMLDKQGDHLGARGVLQQAQAMLQRLGFRGLLNGWATMYLAQAQVNDGSSKEALVTINKAVELCEGYKIHPKSLHLEIQMVLADCLAAEGRDLEAEALYSKTLPALTETLGENAPSVKSAVARVAAFFETRGTASGKSQLLE